MSLQRVASLETFSFEPTNATAGSGILAPAPRRGSDASLSSGLVSLRGLRLSFNPLPDAWDPPESRPDAVQAVGALEVPRWKRIVQVAAAVIYCFLSAGIVFGYAAIKPVLKREGAYLRECSGGPGPAVGTLNNLKSLNLVDPSHPDVATCVELRLNVMFAVAAVACNVAALPVGAILDHCGPRACALLGSCFLGLGAVLMTLALPGLSGLSGLSGRLPAPSLLPFDGLMAGYLSLALGGPFIYISAFHLSNAFPGNSGLVMALITGAFDASSALFLMYRLAYEATAGRLGLDAFFTAYLIVPVVIALLQLTVLPSQSYKTVTELVGNAQQESVAAIREGGDSGGAERLWEDRANERTALLREGNLDHVLGLDLSGNEAAAVTTATMTIGAPLPRQADLEPLLGTAVKADEEARRATRTHDASGVWGALHGRTALQQAATPWFGLMCLFTVVQMLRINYFVATVRPQYAALLGSAAAADRLGTFFDAALPAGGLVAVPLVGVLLDRASTVGTLAALVATATLIGALGVVPADWAAYANVALFVLYRPFYYTAVSDYSAKVFGFRTFGTVYGLVICLAGLGNLAQPGLDFAFHHVFAGDPVPVNLLLLVAGLVVGGGLTGFVAWKARQMRAGGGI